jgi:hypothetical protein
MFQEIFDNPNGYLDDWGDATDECFALLLLSEKDLLKITNVSGPENYKPF